MKKTIAVLFALSSLALADDSWTINPIKDLSVATAGGNVFVDAAAGTITLGNGYQNNLWGESRYATIALGEYAFTADETHGLSLNFTMVAGDYAGHGDMSENNTITVAVVGSDKAVVVGHAYNASQDLFIATTDHTYTSFFGMAESAGVPQVTGGVAYDTYSSITGAMASGALQSPVTVTLDVAWSADDNAFIGTLSTGTGSTTLNLGETFDVSKVVVSLNGNAQPVVSNMDLTMTPEPATATLSLLALAGLAARRRRH